MKNKKRRVNLFSACQYEAIERHLQRQAEKGWQLESIGRFFWRYRRAEPAHLTYAVTYFPDASSLDPGPTEGQKIYEDYCAQAGWRFVAQWVSLLIFCTDQEDPTPIETDETEKFRAIAASMRHSFLPGNVLLLICCLLQIYSQWESFSISPILSLATSLSFSNLVFFSCAAVYCIGALVSYFLWKHRAAAAVARGEPCFASAGRWSYYGGIVILLLLALTEGQYLFLNVNGKPGWLIFLYGTGFTVILLLLTGGVVALCKRLKADRITTGVALVLSALVFTLVLTQVLSAVVSWSMDHGMLRTEEPEQKILMDDRGHSSTVYLYHDQLPLTIEDLRTEEAPAARSYSRDDQRSLLLHRQAGLQRDYRNASEDVELYYALLTPKVPFLYDILRSYMTRSFTSYWGIDYEMAPIDPEPWQAEAAYQKRVLHPNVDDLFEGYYVLCYDGKLLEVRTDLELTAEECSIIAQQLIPQVS